MKPRLHITMKTVGTATVYAANKEPKQECKESVND